MQPKIWDWCGFESQKAKQKKYLVTASEVNGDYGRYVVSVLDRYSPHEKVQIAENACVLIGR